MNIAKIVEKIAADFQPTWAMPDFIHQLDISGTALKKYSGRHGGFPVWVLKLQSKIYKDRYGWVSVTWMVNPILKGRDWVVASDISFAPATSGSFANDKFLEFREVVPISGEDETSLFGIWRRAITIVPPEDHAAEEINAVIARHGSDLNKAKRYWKQQAIEFKRQFGG